MALRWKSKAARQRLLAQMGRKASRPFRRRTKPGAAPGSFQVDPQAPKPIISIIAYGPGENEYKEQVDCSLDTIPDLLSRYPVTWINVDGLGSAAAIERIGELFRLHPLALEDVVHVHQRAKVEDYDDKLFVVARMVWFPTDLESPADDPYQQLAGTSDHSREPRRVIRTADDQRIDTEQVSFFLGTNYVLTFQERPGSDSFDPVRMRLRRHRGRLREQGADSLTYALLDAIIDGYFPVIEELGTRLERLDEDILSRSGRDHLSRLHRLRGDLLVLRKISGLNGKRSTLSFATPTLCSAKRLITSYETFTTTPPNQWMLSKPTANSAPTYANTTMLRSALAPTK